MELVFRKTWFQSQDVWMVGCWENWILALFPTTNGETHLGVCAQPAALGRDLALNSPAGSLWEEIALSSPPTYNRRRACLLDWGMLLRLVELQLSACNVYVCMYVSVYVCMYVICMCTCAGKHGEMDINFIIIVCLHPSSRVHVRICMVYDLHLGCGCSHV